MFRNTPSKNLKRFGKEQQIIQALMLLMAAIYCIAAATMDGPVMDPKVYGDLVTSVNAEWWSWPIFIASMVYLLGIWINGNWRWSPALRVAGSLYHAVTLALFSYMAFGVSAVNPFVVTSGLLSVTNLVFLGWNLGDLSRAILRGK